MKKCTKIQEDVYSIIIIIIKAIYVRFMQKWAETWNLYFKVAKCKVIHIGKKNPMNSYYMKIEENNKKLDTYEEKKRSGDNFRLKFEF